MTFIKRTMLATALLSFGVSTAHAAPFKDIHHSFAHSAIVSLHEKGLISGVSADEFAPNAPIKRKHFVLLLGKTLGVQPIQPGEPTFVDIPRNAPEFGYIEAFAKRGYIQGIGEKTFRGGDDIQRQEAAVILDKIFQSSLIDPSSVDAVRFNDQNEIHSYARNSARRVAAIGLMNGYDQSFHPQKNLTRAEAAAIAYKVLERLDQPSEVRSLPGIKLNAGETTTIPLPFSNANFSYTPVWGWDNPAIGSISADGSFVARAAGKGLISLNLGHVTYQIPIEIIGGEKGQVETESNAAREEETE